MTDPSEMAALKASFRGALSAADSLAAFKDRIEALASSDDVGAEELEQLARVAAAHATAAAALRGLINTMRARRDAGPAA